MKTQQYTQEKGQAIVLIVLAMVVLLGFAALAVDGSMVYSDRRFSQNAADASSLAGGGTAAQWMEKSKIYNSDFQSYPKEPALPVECTGKLDTISTKAVTAAINRAADNDFVVDNDAADDNGVEVLCGKEVINGTKTGGGSVDIFTRGYLDVRSVVTRETQTSFAHFVFQGTLKNTVTAVTRVRPSQPLAFGYAVVSLNPSPCNGKNGIIFSGGSLTEVDGGGLFSNGCISTNGGGAADVSNGSILYFDTAKPEGLSTLTGGYANTGLTADSPKIPQDAYDVPVPDCEGHVKTGSWLEKQSVLSSGLYCIDGDVTLHGTLSGTDVTLLFRGGKLTMNAKAVIMLAGPGLSYVGSAIPGVVIYFPTQYYGPMPESCGNVNQEIKVNGDAGSFLTGAILAPCSDVSMEGGAEGIAYNSQVIGWNVNLGGGAGLNVVFDNNNQYQKPSSLDLHR